MASEEADGWTSAGLGLFSGADRVATFEDPTDEEPMVVEQDPPRPIESIDIPPVGDAAAASVEAAEVWTGTMPEPEPVEQIRSELVETSSPSRELVTVGDPLRAARAALLTSQQPEAPVVATWGVRGAVTRGTGGLVKPAPSSAERAHLEDTETIRRFTWPGPFNVLVANKKGGVGRTPTALVVGGVLAQIRGGGVCVFEATESAGTLSMRAEGGSTAERGLYELLTELPRVRNAATLAWFTQLQSSHAVVIGSVHDRGQLDAVHVNALRSLLDQYFPITVTDSGSTPDSTAFDACIDGADALVLPTTLTGDSVLGVVDTLTRVREAGLRGAHLARTALIVITDDGRPVDPRRANETRALINDLGVGAVATVPHDPHIAAGSEISLERLTGASQRAWVHATAQAVTCASERLTNERH